MQTFTTPMMKQYEEIKKQYSDCLLFYRMGDFYELFMDDAHVGAKVLGITLTARSKGRDGHVPMAGVPYHAVDTYLNRLVKAGHKVAICEQLSEPNKKGIIERDVVRIVTPGTILDEHALEQKQNNFIAALHVSSDYIGLAYADVSTGQCVANQIKYTNLAQIITDEFAHFQPTECILSESTYNNLDVLKVLKQQHGLNIFCFHEWNIYSSQAGTLLKKHFGLQSLASFGIDGQLHAQQASAALIGYLLHTQKHSISHIQKIITTSPSDHVSLDRSTIINLELFSTLREQDIKGSLLAVMDETNTAMGGRLLRQWMLKPLANKELIEKRYDVIETLTSQTKIKKQIISTFERISDMERTLSRLCVGIGNARDLISLRNSIQAVLDIKSLLQNTHCSLLEEIEQSLESSLTEVTEYITFTLVDEPPVSLKDGGLIKEGYSKKLDDLRSIVNGNRDWLTQLEIQEKKRTGIGNLKIRYNQVFGFYIEISKSHTHAVPHDYIRKQTLVNGERYSTIELKQKEEIILSAQDEINKLEFQFFNQLLEKILNYIPSIQRASQSIAVLDCLISFAIISQKYHYTRPKILYSDEMRIKDGRHPVVEQLLADTTFVPNSVTLDSVHQQLLVITGPNMAGKSVFIRQVALIVLMAQMGCFVPAHQAHLSLVDRIFVRSGASDAITSGLSTFMVEMVETAYILNHMTKKSLVIMDEIGRGTSTYDGISIAWAVAQYLVTHEKHPAKTLFATHYHELQALEQKHPQKIKNMHMAVVEDNGHPVFLHTLLPGGASASFGVAVAKLAGVPNEVIHEAETILSTLENQDKIPQVNSDNKKPSLKKTDGIHSEIASLDISRLTPLDALNTLAQLQQKVKSND
jgi:DNA mismatch repair protein MutS